MLFILCKLGSISDTVIDFVYLLRVCLQMMLSPVSQPQLALIKHIRETSTTRVWCFEILYVLQQSFTFIEKKIFYPAINQQSFLTG